jgi:hypothetical protein
MGLKTHGTLDGTWSKKFMRKGEAPGFLMGRFPGVERGQHLMPGTRRRTEPLAPEGATNFS